MPGQVFEPPPVNHSNIAHDVVKWNALPQGVTLTGHSARSTIGPGGTRSEATIDFNVPSGQWVAFERWAVGFSNAVPAPGVGSPPLLHRDNPVQHPLKPWLYAVTVEILEGVALAPDLNAVAQAADGSPLNVDEAGNPVPPGEPNRRQILPMVRYEDSSNGTDGYVRARIHFAELPFEVRGDQDVALIPGNAGEMERFVERRRELNAELLPLPPGDLRFFDPALALGRPAGAALPVILGDVVPQSGTSVIIPVWDIMLIWYGVPDLNFAAWELCVGRLNDAPFDSARGAGPPHPTGTLLCFAPKYRESRTRGTTGRPQWDITFHFQKRCGFGGPPPGDPKVPLTWNHFPAGDGGWYIAQSNPAIPLPPFAAPPVIQPDFTKTPYKLANMRQLFTLPNPTTVFQ